MTIASGSSDNVIGIDEAGVNELIKELFRRKVSEFARVPIELIPWQRIKELAVKYVVHDHNHVLNARIEKTEPVALVTPTIPIQAAEQAKLASAFTTALASVFGVRQRLPVPVEPQFQTREFSSTSASDDDAFLFAKPSVPAERALTRLSASTTMALDEITPTPKDTAETSSGSATPTLSSKNSTPSRSARGQNTTTRRTDSAEENRNQQTSACVNRCRKKKKE